MEINIQKLEQIVTGIIVTGIIGYTAYLGYGVFFNGPQPEASPSLTSVSPSAFSGFPKIQEAATAATSKSIALKKKDYQFVESAIYKSFIDNPIDVPLSDKRGRDDPFVPYATP